MADEKMEIDADLEKPISQRDKLKEKLCNIVLKPLGLLACLYFFICSLDTMSSSFRLISGKYTSEVFQRNKLLTNPLAGLMIGVLATAVVQSSSTSTSIVVSMVASQILEVKYAIPIVMGANIGTSITSALVSLGQVGNRENFRRAFAGATVHDMFNCLSVMVLLPIEVTTGYLNHVTKFIVSKLVQYDINAKEPELLHAITKPLTNIIIQLDKESLKNITLGLAGDDVQIRKHICSKIVRNFSGIEEVEIKKCKYMFESLQWPEWSIGIILLALSLLVLITCLIFMVKILNSIFIGPVAKLLQKVVNSDFPGPFKYLTGYFTLLLGCLLTIIIQSSSVFMSTLTPLVGMGLVSIERVFPLTLGSNVGTTVTGILAAFSASPDTLKYSLQIALCHSLFNISGILIWYPLPFMRRVPLNIAKFLGNTTAKYRWFPILYLLVLFFLIPISVFGLSMAGLVVSLIVLIPLGGLALFILILNLLQTKAPGILPKRLRTWEFLPEPLRSLKPYDEIIVKHLLCCKCCKRSIQNTDLEAQNENNIEEKPEKELEKKVLHKTLTVRDNEAFVVETKF